MIQPTLNTYPYRNQKSPGKREMLSWWCPLGMAPIWSWSLRWRSRHRHEKVERCRCVSLSRCGSAGGGWVGRRLRACRPGTNKIEKLEFYGFFALFWGKNRKFWQRLQDLLKQDSLNASLPFAFFFFVYIPRS